MWHVCLSVTWLRCAQMVVGIEVLLGVETVGDPRHLVLDRVLMPLMQGKGFHVAFAKWGLVSAVTHWPFLNTSRPL